MKLSSSFYQFLIVFMFVELSLSGFGQQVTTPEVYSMKQDVFNTTNLYTGSVSINIPLCDIKTRDIKIPVSLSYIGGSGFQPANPYSSAGLGWRVCVGGAITRTVHGSTDEYPDTENQGFFYMDKSGLSNETVLNIGSLYNDDGSGGIECPTCNDRNFCPDVFSFSFLGITGYFVMGYDGEFHIQSDEIVNVSKGDHSIGTFGDYNSFTLTAKDGVKYTFGSSPYSIEWSAGEYGSTYVQNAWYLCSITFPNGRSVNFNYSDNRSYDIHYKTIKGQNDYSHIVPVTLTGVDFDGGYLTISPIIETQAVAISESVKLIDNISLYNDGDDLVSSINFNYTSKVSNRYYLLSNIDVNGKNYAFSYFNTSYLPTYDNSFGTDFWGYYNHQPELVGPLESSNFDSNLNQTLTISEKQPYLEYTKAGVLQSITYPTGGQTSYEYELNTYNFKGMTSNGGYVTSYIWQETIPRAGGLRVKTITTGNIVKKYRYLGYFDPTNPDPDEATDGPLSAESSGILYRMPALTYFSQRMINQMSVQGEPPVTYAQVIEYQNDTSYTVYSYSSARDYPDVSSASDDNCYVISPSTSEMWNHINKKSYVGSLGVNTSRALERGKLKSLMHYNSAHNLVFEQHYTYNQDPNRYSEYVTGAYYSLLENAQAIGDLGLELSLDYGVSGFGAGFVNSYKIYTFPVYLEKESTTVYDENGANGVTTEKHYLYDDFCNVNRVTTYTSREDSVVTVTKYAQDVNSGLYSSMKAANFLSYPVEQVSYKNDKVVDARLTTYKAAGTSYVPDKTYSSNINSPLSAFTYFNGSSKDSHYKSTYDISYDSYNSTTSNIQQTTSKDGIITSYLWDDTGNYPMAKVDGVSYSTISPLNGKSADYSSISLYSSLNSLASGAMISTYSYLPLVGLTSQTDANRITTYYEYDDYGRLKNVRNDDQNITGRYFYHYFDETTVDYPTLNTSVSSINFTSSSGSTSFDITSDCSWSISDNASWLSVSPSSGSNDNTVNVSVSTNTLSSSRTATITITYTGGLTKTISVSQAGPPSLSLDASSVSVHLDEPTWVSLSSNTSWTITKSFSLDWVIISEVEGGENISSGSGSMTLHLSADPSAYSYSSGTVYITTTDGSITRTLNVTFY